MRLPLRPACATLALGVGLPVLVAAAQADDAFRAGIDARNDKRWPVVETEMRRAIQADPKESDRRVGGGFLSRGTQYLPYFLLGEALFQQQNCAGAVEAWAVSEQQGAVRSRPDFVTIMKEGFSTCASRGVLLPADYNPLLASTRVTITEVTEQAGRLSKLGQTRREIWRPEMTDQYERARAELETAQKHLGAATRGRIRNEFALARAASDRAAVILRGLESTLDAAVDAVASIQRQVKDVERVLADATRADRALDEFSPVMTPDLSAARQRARGLVAQARTGLATASGTTDAAAVKEALRRAEEAAAAFNNVRDQARQLARGSLEQRFGHAVAAATDALSVVGTSLALLDRLAAARPGAGPANLASEREAIERQLAEIRRRFDAAREATNLAVVEHVTRQVSDARERLAALVAGYGPLSLRDRGVPPALEEGARLFLAGDHQQALSVLEAAPAEATAEAELALHVHLFRAAAAFALYVRSGETDDALLQRARADVRRCRELNPGFVPDSAAFAPRFIAFFQAAPPGEGTAEP